MNQRFDEDRAELEAHLAERVQAYIELGETPEQAELSARAKFGDTEIVARELRWRRVARNPFVFGGLTGAFWLAPSLLLNQLTGWLLAPIQHERQEFGLGGSPALIFLTQVYASLVPAALIVAWKGSERFPRHGLPLVLGILALSPVFQPTRDPLDLLLVAVPTLHGALVGLKLGQRARRARQQS